MKSLLGLVAAGALFALGTPGVAKATPITFTDTTGPGLHLCLSASAPAACNGGAVSTETTTFTLDITDSGFAPGSLITSAELVLTLADDGGSGEGSEKIGLLLDGTSIPYTENANHDAVITLSDFTSLADGKLLVVLSADSGDFFLEGAKLTVVGDPAPGTDEVPVTAAAVPAPGALLVLGAGLVGTIWRRRAAR